ncbi:MAG: hypothetical protein WBP64_06310 [Nitrososphaeraceae archaeon]
MVRPTRKARDSVAITHVTISLKTKRLLDKLKTEGGYKTIDEALLNLLAQQKLQKPIVLSRAN